MVLKTIVCLSVILLNSGLSCFSMDSMDSRNNLQSKNKMHEQTSLRQREFPRYLRKLHQFHKHAILDEYAGYFAQIGSLECKEYHSKAIFKYCSTNLHYTLHDYVLCLQYYKDPKSIIKLVLLAKGVMRLQNRLDEFPLGYDFTENELKEILREYNYNNKALSELSRESLESLLIDIFIKNNRIIVEKACL